ncbi:MAG TPA: HlyD family type I secretion periplasmic adaptor subunit [Roseiarcus sp.]|jgi:hemolysin D
MTALQTVEPKRVKGRDVAPTTPRLNRGDAEFLPAALEILETPLSPIRSSLIPTICAFVTAALAWAFIGQVDIIASAQGKIQTVGRTKVIQPLETSKVLALAVENGQSVKAGELLLELDPSEVKADEATLTRDLRALKAEAVRRSVAIESARTRRPPPTTSSAWDADTPADIVQRESQVLAGDLSQLASVVASLGAQAKQKAAARDRLKATIAAQEALLATLKQRVDMREELLARGAGSKAGVIDAEEVYQTQQTNLTTQMGELGEVEAAALTAQRDLDKAYSGFLADNEQKLADVERKIDEDAKKIDKARIRTDYMTLKSPIDGVVQGLTVTTIGQVVASGQQVMEIVPNDVGLEIESYLPNMDIGFVKAGQPAVVKVESFPFTDYGTIDAHVVRIAHDAIPQIEAEQREENPVHPPTGAVFGGAQRTQNLVFPVTLKLDASSMMVDGAPVPLTSGMAVTVEIKTGARRILSYVFSPLVDTVSTAMKER